MLRRAVARLTSAPTLKASLEWGLSPDQIEFQNVARTFAQKEIEPFADKWDAEKIFPLETFKKAAELGFGGIYVKDDIGTGLGRLDAAVVFEQLSYACPATAAFISIHNMVASMIDQFGTEEQRQQYLPSLASMETIASYCLTEPGSGSDSAALKMTARRDGDHFIVNGEKAFISGAGASGLYAIMVRTADSGPKGISCILVPKDTPGLSFGKNENKLGWNCQPTRQVILQDARVPVKNVIGELNGGFKIAMKGLDGGRVNIGVCSLGGAQRCFDIAQQYVKDRNQFGKPLAALQDVQFKLATMGTQIHASRLMLRQAAMAMDSKDPNMRSYCAMAKLFATEECYKVVDQALQLHGGYGYLRDYSVERYMRDLRVHRILEGTSEVMKLIISRDLLA